MYSHWNYRVVHTVEPSGEEVFSIEEVYYKGEDRPAAYGAAAPLGEDLEVLRDVLARMKEALDKPVLEAADFGGGSAGEQETEPDEE